MFINWPIADGLFESCDLLDGTDFSDREIVFFDPLGFATSHGLRSNDDNIAAARYIACTEEAFMRYLAGIKTASEHIRAVLSNRGVLVIRSQIPNSQFKIRKKSSVGAQTYTESVASPFFWLEEFLGKYSFNYCNLKTVKYLVRNHPLRKIFGRSAVHLLQTQNSIGEGKAQVIAGSGVAFKSPAITRVTFDTTPGQIYLIPRFEIEREHVCLFEAFERVLHGKALGLNSPKWLGHYEIQLEHLNPFRSELEKLDHEIEVLESRKLEVLEKMEATMRLIDLLVESGPELESAARTALDFLGFDCPEGDAGMTGEVFTVTARNDTVRRVVVRVASTGFGPVLPSELDLLRQAIESRDPRVKPKGILIGNASRLDPPTERDTWFDPECINEARSNDFCLMSTFELYTAVCHVLSSTDSGLVDDIKSSLRQDILDCDSQFALNRRKYGI